MRKLILEEWISPDGYAADKKAALDFFPSAEQNKYSDADQLKFMDSIDTASTSTEIIADKLNSTPKMVFSNTLMDAPWGNWPAAQVINGSATEQLKQLKNREGKNMVLWGSISLAQNLIDEYHIQVCPTLTGAGRPLFPVADVYKNFKLISSRRYDTGVMFLHYES